MDEQQLWRIQLWELLLLGSLNTFKNKSSVFSIVDELFQLVAGKKDDHNQQNNETIDVIFVLAIDCKNIFGVHQQTWKPSNHHSDIRKDVQNIAFS